MKKILSILFLFVYLGTTAGVNIQLHYCHGYVSHISLGISDEDPCACPDIPRKNCCADEFRYLKLDENHLVKSFTPDFQHLELFADIPAATIIFIEHTDEQSVYFAFTSPHLVHSDLGTLNCVWRI
ncbi:MAG: HYC_CC_PP family protein [Flavobacteriales bacterium]